MQKEVHWPNQPPFITRFGEHYNYKYANNSSKLAQDVIEEERNFGPMNEIMEVIHVAKKVRMLDTLEKFYIYKETKCGIQISDKLTIQSKTVSEVLFQHTIP